MSPFLMVTHFLSHSYSGVEDLAGNQAVIQQIMQKEKTIAFSHKGK